MTENDLIFVEEVRKFFIRTRGGIKTEIYLNSIEKTHGITVKDCASHLGGCKCEAYAKALLVLSCPACPTTASLILIENMIEKFSLPKWKKIPFRLFAEKARSSLR